jgi:hypothetical protein
MLHGLQNGPDLVSSITLERLEVGYAPFDTVGGGC